MTDEKKRVLIAMSGGVDSSVAAALMVEKGYRCMGVTMKLLKNDETELSGEHTCCSLDDVQDARSVAARLGMPYYVFNFAEEFDSCVINRFIRAYETGSTPNPCIDCNRFMKYGKLYQRARELGCSHIVTGHYARICYDEKKGRYLLKRGKNTAKDQSYVLYFMTQEQLSSTIFPLGEYSDKEQVRQIAARHGFINAKKHDSQDICFVPDGDYAAFIEKHTGKHWEEGDFVDRSGKVLGHHKGIIRYTIGQRRGLGLSLPAPLYVCGKDMERNEVILSPESDLFKKELIATDFNWIDRETPEPGTVVRVTAKPRYRAKEAAADAMVLPDGRVKVAFDEPQRALTVGQAVVLYDGDCVVGGGTIEET